MATVPGPDPNRPLPIPGAPAQEPPHREEDERHASPPDSEPAWEDPAPWSPDRETAEPGVPV